MFRAAIAAGTELGKRVEGLYNAGALIPDEITIAMIKERLGEPDAAEGFVLDGFPRNLAQSDALDEMLSGIGRDLDAILYFDIPDDVGIERALERAKIEGRTDDTPEAIAKRLDTYHRETEPVVEHYRATGKLVPIHAARSIEDVSGEISHSLQVFAA
jgi:adenylate kinase